MSFFYKAIPASEVQLHTCWGGEAAHRAMCPDLFGVDERRYPILRWIVPCAESEHKVFVDVRESRRRAKLDPGPLSIKSDVPVHGVYLPPDPDYVLVRADATPEIACRTTCHELFHAWQHRSGLIPEFKGFPANCTLAEAESIYARALEKHENVETFAYAFESTLTRHPELARYLA